MTRIGLIRDCKKPLADARNHEVEISCDTPVGGGTDINFCARGLANLLYFFTPTPPPPPHPPHPTPPPTSAC